MAVRAPRHLTSARKALYRKVVDDYGLADEPAALETLRLACEALDRCEQARAAIARDGAYVPDRWNVPKAHPAVAVEQAAAIRAARMFRELSLDSGDGLLSEARVPRVNGARS